MPSRRNPVQEAAFRADTLLRDLGRDLRVARLAAGRSQAEVAARLDASQGWVSLVERGRIPALAVSDLARHAAAVGLTTWIRLFPDGRVVLDVPQLALLERFRLRLHPAWTWELEVPMPEARDLRAADGRISIPSCSIMVEAITRLADLQAQVRAARRKHRDLGADRLILLVADTRANRRALREAGTPLLAAFPMSPRAALRALADGRDPGADAIILL